MTLKGRTPLPKAPPVVTDTLSLSPRAISFFFLTGVEATEKEPRGAADVERSPERVSGERACDDSGSLDASLSSELDSSFDEDEYDDPYCSRASRLDSTRYRKCCGVVALRGRLSAARSISNSSANRRVRRVSSR